MTDAFDPYHAWLGIPKSEQPCDHYRLLGLAQFEDNLDVIESAAERQMAHVRKYQTTRPEAATKLMTELAHARSCLLIGEKKESYDEKLKQSQTALVEPPWQEDTEQNLFARDDLPLDLNSLPSPPPANRAWGMLRSKWSNAIIIVFGLAVIGVGINYLVSTRWVDANSWVDDSNNVLVSMEEGNKVNVPKSQKEPEPTPPQLNSGIAKESQRSDSISKKAVNDSASSRLTEHYETIDLLQRIKQTQPTLPRGWSWNADMLVVGPRGNGSHLKVPVPELRDVREYTIIFKLWKYGRSTGKPLFYFKFPIDRGARLRARYYYGRSAALGVQSMDETVEPGPFAGGSRAFVQGNKQLEIQVSPDRTRVILEGSSGHQEFVTPKARPEFEDRTPDFQVVGISGRSMHYRIVKFQVRLPK